MVDRGAVRGAVLCGGISGNRRSGDIDAVVTETGQRTAERRASCGDGPTHRGIPGDHLVGTPFGGWGVVGRHLQRHPVWRLGTRYNVMGGGGKSARLFAICFILEADLVGCFSPFCDTVLQK